MSNLKTKWIGRSVPRKEDQRLLTGEGQYVSDIVLPFMVEVGFLRSPHAHARIRRIDVSKANAPRGGVAGVGFWGVWAAGVVGKDRSSAEDAIRCIEVDYEPLPAVLDAEAGLRE